MVLRLPTESMGDHIERHYILYDIMLAARSRRGQYIIRVKPGPLQTKVGVFLGKTRISLNNP